LVAVGVCSLAKYHLHGQNIALSITKIRSPLYYVTFIRLFMCCSWPFSLLEDSIKFYLLSQNRFSPSHLIYFRCLSLYFCCQI
jgi:hypothetical protein